jgi:hypothetical protein
MSAIPGRARYSAEVKAIVKAKYHLCRTPEDRDALAAECGIASREKLYNLASRLSTTRSHADSRRVVTSDEQPYDATEDASRLLLRDDPETLTWSEDQDRYLSEHFGRTFVESIAFMLNRSETAVAYRARRLGLRGIPKYYDKIKVTAWLGVSEREMTRPGSRILDIHPCTDRHGRVRITLVSTTSLARLLVHARARTALIDRHGADLFFISDVIESVADLQRGAAAWEADAWVSHGHTCLNPFSEMCFGLFYKGFDEKMAGAELEPWDLSPSANVSSDSWRRGMQTHLAPADDAVGAEDVAQEAA